MHRAVSLLACSCQTIEVIAPSIQELEHRWRHRTTSEALKGRERLVHNREIVSRSSFHIQRQRRSYEIVVQCTTNTQRQK